MNHDTLLRFTKDQKVPINIFDEPYFSYFLELYDKDFHTKKAYEMLENTVKKFSSETAFLDEYYNIRNRVIEEIKKLPAYEKFLTANLNKYKITLPNFPNANKGDVYKVPNIGNYYLSIDLQKANFQMLKKFDKSLVLDCDSYEKLISKFTDMEYFKKSKYTRQVIFGNMNPSRQTTMQKFFTRQILDFAFEELNISLEDVAVFTFDELVIKETDFISEEKCSEIKRKIKEVLDLDVSVESFYLKNLADKDWFVKEKEDKSFSFKKVPGIYYAQAYKYYKNMEITDNDLLFFYEGTPAKFLKPVF